MGVNPIRGSQPRARWAHCEQGETAHRVEGVGGGSRPGSWAAAHAVQAAACSGGGRRQGPSSASLRVDGPRPSGGKARERVPPAQREGKVLF